MDLRDQLKNLFPDHVEQDFQMPEGSEEELKNISKKIKTTLGIGGSEKDGVIIIQGDNRDKIMKILSDMGYKTKRVGG